jgi:flagellar biosynthetic protein FlhB
VSGAKTEEPTPARLRKAREEGDSGASLYAAEAVGLVVAAALLPATVTAVASRFDARMRDAIRQAAAPDVTTTFDVAGLAKDVAMLSVPVVASVLVAGALVSLLQTGGVFQTRRALARDPLARLGALFSAGRLFAIGRGVLGGVVVGCIVVRELRLHAADLVRTSGRLRFLKPAAAAMVGSVVWKVALASLALAAVDVAVTRGLWRARLRMSREDVRRERREAEGDPVLRRALERERAEAIARGAAADVRFAQIVIHEPGRAACALRYAEGDAAPVVLATGTGGAADVIVRHAREHGVPVCEDAALAHTLANLTAREPIPEALYDAVAETMRDASE